MFVWLIYISMVILEYTPDTKFAFFDGLKFTLDETTHYFLNSTIRERLHRYIWAHHNGDIPDNYHIHHIDGNKFNNNVSNLQLMYFSEHLRQHGIEHAIFNKDWFEKFHSAGIEKAKEWHASKEGNKWHKNHYEKMKEVLHKKTVKVCDNCGVSFETVDNNVSRFCSNKCKSAWRRKSGVDNEIRRCEYCGNKYETNKYSKQRVCSKTCSNRKYPRLTQLRSSSKN